MIQLIECETTMSPPGLSKEVWHLAVRQCHQSQKLLTHLHVELIVEIAAKGRHRCRRLLTGQNPQELRQAILGQVRGGSRVQLRVQGFDQLAQSQLHRERFDMDGMP